jgi:hypothetical protein
MIAGEAEPFVIVGLALVCLLLTGLALYMAVPASFHLETRHFVYVGMTAVAALVYSAALTAIYDSNRQDFWKHLGLFLGPALVALGWVVTNEVNVLNSRKQHTITLIMQYFTNTQRITDKDHVNKNLPWPAKLDGTKIDFDDTTNELLRTVARELNYFDFLASAILRREIQDTLLHRVFQNVVRHYYIQFEPYILHWQKNNPETWADLALLYDKWKLPTDPARSAPST